MRFLYRGQNGAFELTQDFINNDKGLKYAALSHTWSPRGALDEVTYDDIISRRNNYAEKLQGFEKLRFCLDQAAEDDLHYVWIDTCCINRSNAVELQEAITSMFKWYAHASQCYAFLTDVDAAGDGSNGEGDELAWTTAFRESRWFRRGWTLQELLAPRSVGFFSRNGTRLGDKFSLRALIRDITGIPEGALSGTPLSDFDEATRFQWAQGRETLRPEDRAYCLFGIFGVYMPLIYGEGENAFVRLKQELRRESRDKAMVEQLFNTLPTSSSAAFNSRDTAERSSECHPGTRVELLRDIVTWTNRSDDRCIYWLEGIAGMGKSTIARTVARTHHLSGTLGASFFFSRGGGDSGNARLFCTTLARDLASSIPAAKTHIYTALSEYPEITRCTLQDQWENLIIKPLSKVTPDHKTSNIVIVLDALDECDNHRDTRTILRALPSVRLIPSVRLRIFVTGRPENAIVAGFAQIPKDQWQGFVLSDIPSNVVDRDLEIFFSEEFAEFCRGRRLPPTWPGHDKIARLVRLSCGLFIWASTACRWIRKGASGASKRLAKLLHGNTETDAAKQLDRMYTTVLQEAVPDSWDAEDRAELHASQARILGSIVLLSAPLPVGSLANLLKSDPSDVLQTLADLSAICHIPEDDDRPIRIHHPTFRDFLLDPDRCSKLGFHVNKRLTHQLLSEGCILVMSQMLRRNICGLDAPGTRSQDIDRARIKQCIPPELEYACLYWAQHHDQASIRLQDNDKTHVFFKKHFLHWLETMSLMNKMSDAAAVIRTYQSLLVPADNSVQIPFVKDSRRLFYKFQSEIEQAPLQVYCAALVFISPENELRSVFWQQLRPWFRRVHVALAVGPKTKDEYNYVNDLAFWPDGQSLASGTMEEWVRVWDIPSRRPLTKYEGQTDKVSSVAISHDGLLLASGSDDTTVMLWDVKSKATERIWTGHSRWVNTVAFSADGSLLASGSMDTSIRLYDLPTREETRILRPGLKDINCVAFSPDSSTLAAATADQVIPIWDLASGDMRMLLDGHAGPINSVQFSPDGKCIASGSDDMTVRLWNIGSGVQVSIFKGHIKKVWAVSFSHNGLIVVSGSEDKTIRFWNVNTRDCVYTLAGHTSGVNAVRFSPNGQLLASGSFNDEIRLWNGHTGAAIGKLGDFEEEQAAAGAISEKAQHMGLNANIGAPSAAREAHNGSVTCLKVSVDGQTIASGGRDHIVKLWSIDGTLNGTLVGHSGAIEALEFSPCGKMLASASDDHTIKLWDVCSATIMHTLIEHSGTVNGIIFDRAGKLLVSCSSDRSVVLWNPTDGVAIGRLEGHLASVTNVVLSHDGSMIASGSDDGAICLWDVECLHKKTDIPEAHRGSITALAFCQNDRQFISAAADKTLAIWTAAGSRLTTLPGHSQAVTAAAISPDGELAVSGSEDGTVRLWDIETGYEKACVAIGAAVHHLAFSECQSLILTDRGSIAVQNTRPSTPDGDSGSLRTGYPMFVTRDWVVRKGMDMLRLPDAFEAISVATYKNVAVLGHHSGAITFVEL